MAILFAHYAKKLHTLPINSDIAFKNYKEDLREKLNLNRKLSRSQKAWDEAALQWLPEPTCYMHGDLHFGNLISAEGKQYFIDLGFFSMGIPEFDIVMLLFMSYYTPAPVVKHIAHISKHQAKQFWNIFYKEYFGSGFDDSELKKILQVCLTLKMMTLFGKYVPYRLVCFFAGIPFHKLPAL